MDERQIARAVTDAEVTCELDGSCHRLSLYNLSSHGCMMDAPAGLLLDGRRLALGFPGCNDSISARVIWQSGHYIGVQFIGNLPDEVVEALAFKADEGNAAFLDPAGYGGRLEEHASPARRRSTGR